MKFNRNMRLLILAGVVFAIILCFSIVPQECKAAPYRVAGTWDQTGTGTIDHENYRDNGTFTLQSKIDSEGTEWLNKFSSKGDYTLGGRPYVYDYTYTEKDLGGPVAIENNHMSMIVDGLTYDLTLLSANELVMTVQGTETYSERDYDITYKATKQTSGGDGGGGGCSLSSLPMNSLLLLTPIFILFKK